MSKHKKLKSKYSFSMFRPNEKFGRIMWEFHLTDKDPSPSIPHGHSIGNSPPLKLDVFSGDVYKTTGQLYGNISKRDLFRLVNNADFIKFEGAANAAFEQFDQKLYKNFGYPRSHPQRIYQHKNCRNIVFGKCESRHKKNDTSLIFVSFFYIHNI